MQPMSGLPQHKVLYIEAAMAEKLQSHQLRCKLNLRNLTFA